MRHSSPTSRLIALMLEPYETAERGDIPIYVASNAFWEPLTVELPEVKDRHWYRVVDTSLPAEEDIVPEEEAFFLPEMEYSLHPRSTIVLVAK